MEMVFESNRLIFRKFKPIDAQYLWALNCDPIVIKHTGNPPFNTWEDAAKFVENYSEYKNNGFGRWAVILKETNEFIGCCGLKINEQALVDLGFRFFKAHWGKGYATEAAIQTVSYGIKELHVKTIIGRAAKRNIASIKVLEKCGMKYWKSDGCMGIHDASYYRIESTGFEALR